MNISNILGSYSKREVKRILPMVNKIMDLDDEITKLSDEQLKNKTYEFKERLAKGETLDDILVEAFAVVREASWRVLKMKPFKVQLIGGVVLHQGRVAEMKTGEGKTLVATCPAYLNALAGKGVHIITVNDYLAERDKTEMGKVYDFLGLTTGVILNSMDPNERRKAYNCDITYGTNSEYGFDYLRDNMVITPAERVQRGLNFAIVDEVDSIFIDEARTPLIIAQQGGKSTEIYRIADRLAKSMKEEVDFNIDEKTKAIMITDEGMDKAEKCFGMKNFADASNMELQHHTIIALRANYTMDNGVDYIVRDGEVMIVDKFTGRVMDGRRFNEGLHQALEAKEGVKVQEENDTLATITYQNFFRLYNKVSGMSGTAETEEEEFRDIYDMDVVVIPTNKPVIRNDRDDVLYKTEYDKFKAVVDEIESTHKKGQPVLAGTASVEKSEILSFMLKKKGIHHQVLNAKQHAKEAQIVAKAGQKGTVTIATNMAGRGTDIKLGEGVKELGGLKIIGTERHEARRIDNQLRGRSGRQGDPGESVFYVSLEDDIVKRFAEDRLENLEKSVEINEKGPIENKKLREIVEIAQHNVESTNLETRKNLVKYDKVLSIQRELIYKQRNEVVDKEDISDVIEIMIKGILDTEVTKHVTSQDEKYQQDVAGLLVYLKDIFGHEEPFDKYSCFDLTEIKNSLYDVYLNIYHNKKAELGEEMNMAEKAILLRSVDRKWVEHIETMDNLKKYITFQSYRQTDPAVAYGIEGSQVFDDMVYDLKKEVVKYIFHVKINN
ncbi:preprotein translocase subunit SecA [Clostridium sp. JN-9]|uniref:preprotein translocase subunit SecA n=1 Tax=Clostridium sp. JN-9 TaxID=2507159 RepID=UPI000FFE063A|nr:preprotein translocase subunit SecA [Clostridium sp. JN-9]QAT41032.1 preprotein translocase subunit SecA [Clostridium sp. JN-9]